VRKTPEQGRRHPRHLHEASERNPARGFLWSGPRGRRMPKSAGDRELCPFPRTDTRGRRLRYRDSGFRAGGVLPSPSNTPRHPATAGEYALLTEQPREDRPFQSEKPLYRPWMGFAFQSPHEIGSKHAGKAIVGTRTPTTGPQDRCFSHKNPLTGDSKRAPLPMHIGPFETVVSMVQQIFGCLSVLLQQTAWSTYGTKMVSLYVTAQVSSIELLLSMIHGTCLQRTVLASTRLEPLPKATS